MTLSCKITRMKANCAFSKTKRNFCLIIKLITVLRVPASSFRENIIYHLTATGIVLSYIQGYSVRDRQETEETSGSCFLFRTSQEKKCFLFLCFRNKILKECFLFLCFRNNDSKTLFLVSLFRKHGLKKVFLVSLFPNQNFETLFLVSLFPKNRCFEEPNVSVST